MENFDDFFDFGSPVKKTEQLICGHPKHNSVIKLPDAISKTEQELLKKTLTNLGCPYGMFETGFLSCHFTLTKANEEVLFRRIKFNFGAKYLFMERFLCVCSEFSLGLSWIKERNGRAINGPKKKCRVKKNPLIHLTSTPMLNHMFRNTLADYNVVESDYYPDFRLCDCGWPGNDEVQRVRLKAMYLLPREKWPEFSCKQIWGSETPLVILDVLDEMILKVEMENLDDIFSTPKKEKRKRERDTTVVKKLKLDTVISQSVESKVEVNVSTTTDDVSTTTDVQVRISDPQRRTASARIEYKGAHFQGPKVLNDYKKAFDERKNKVVLKRQTWYEILFWSVALFAFDLYMPYFANTSAIMFLSRFIIGVGLLIRCLYFSPNYFWTILTVVYVRWIDTEKFLFLPGEIYATIALQMLCIERKKLMVIPLIAFLVYCYFTNKNWTILIQYPLALISSLKGFRVQEGANVILIAPYKDVVLLIAMLVYIVCSCNVS